MTSFVKLMKPKASSNWPVSTDDTKAMAPMLIRETLFAGAVCWLARHLRQRFATRHQTSRYNQTRVRAAGCAPSPRCGICQHSRRTIRARSLRLRQVAGSESPPYLRRSAVKRNVNVTLPLHRGFGRRVTQIEHRLTRLIDRPVTNPEAQALVKRYRKQSDPPRPCGP